MEIASLESEKMIIESLESEKNGSLKSESLKSNRVPTGAYWVPNIFLKKKTGLLNTVSASVNTITGKMTEMSQRKKTTDAIGLGRGETHANSARLTLLCDVGGVCYKWGLLVRHRG